MQPKVKKHTYFYLLLPSTQSAAWRLAREGAPSGSVVVSRSQTAGRGRYGRRWFSPPGGLWFSLLFYPVSASEASRFLFLSAAALQEAVQQVTGIKTDLKIPNDLYWQGKKVAGLILEVEAEKAVLGVGINVNCTALPEGLSAVSLKEIAGGRVSRSALLRLFLFYLRQRYPPCFIGVG